jgi:alkylation response protein AidB-like acyl-CoA dehydrogenase
LAELNDLEQFRGEVRAFVEAECPPGIRAVREGEKAVEVTPAVRTAWAEALADKGWSCPTWPVEYGGGGLSQAHARIVNEELGRAGTWNPAGGFGTAMLGPVLLEFANEAQKKEHLTNIARARVRWAQGYSEPGAGSDLASLQTRAVRDGDEFVINGQKIWTSGAQDADWMFCLVRTDPDVPKHDGISFILFDLKSPGVDIQPIKLISGTSAFCQVFFQDVRAKATNLVGTENGGWTIAKRLLQHERSMLGGGGGGRRPGASAERPRGSALADSVRPYVGPEGEGELADPILRDEVAQLDLDALCFGLAVKRSGQASRAGQGPGAATSMFKLYASEMNKRRAELMISAMGAQGLGWEGDGFTQGEINQTRGWLRSKGNSIEGGTSEVQLNVIAKRVLGLPD